MPRLTRTATFSIILATATLGTAAILSLDTVFPALAVVAVVTGVNVASDRLASRVES